MRVGGTLNAARGAPQEHRDIGAYVISTPGTVLGTDHELDMLRMQTRVPRTVPFQLTSQSAAHARRT